MNKYPKLSNEKLLRRLEPPKGKVRMVLDTDTFNEIDDQFAVVYALQSPERLQVEAMYAAPFYNDLSDGPGDGMEKSYDEIVRILGRLGRSADGFAYRGSSQYLPGDGQPVNSEAATDLIKRAMASDDNDPLYVVAIGAITNVASAILLEPRIIEKIVVVWLGGHMPAWRDTREFNLQQDVPAARVVFDSGVPLVQIPCYGVASHLLTTLPEIETYVQGQGAIGDFLAERFREVTKDHFGGSRVIWDISTIAYLINDGWVSAPLVHSPILTDQVTYSVDTTRHFIRQANMIYRDPVFQDLFRKLAKHT